MIQATDAPGTLASIRMPAPTSRLPPAARVRGSPLTRAPATAASGRTLTAAAAASGSSDQPAISSRTSRKRTPVRAAETSARATVGPNGRRAGAAAKAPGRRRRFVAAGFLLVRPGVARVDGAGLGSGSGESGDGRDRGDRRLGRDGAGDRARTGNGLLCRAGAPVGWRGRTERDRSASTSMSSWIADHFSRRACCHPLCRPAG